MSAGNNNSAAFERHLKKIYDCLNIGSNKKAVQEVDRLPKNVKDLTVFKALKALALIRMSKRRQAFEILGEINLKEDLDESTLRTMTSCYKESVDVAKIVDLYEAASSRKPQDPQVMSRLFMAYVRVFNFKRQKEIALQMYKTFAQDKRLYSFWAIMSLVMQSQERTSDDQDAPDKRVCLSLAEKMCEKMIDEERTHEEIELYLMILRKQNKHEEEYRFLTGPICLRLTDHLSWYNRRRAYLCLDLKMYSRAFKHYFPTLIQDYPDQTEYYQGLFKSALLLDKENQSQQQPLVPGEQQQQATNVNQTSGTPVKSTSALAECFDIVEKQCQCALESLETTKESKGRGTPKNLSRTSSSNLNRKRVLRGPFMARIELYQTIVSNESNLPSSIFSLCKNQFSGRFANLGALFLDFFQSFSRKVICFHDLEYMLNQHKLSQDEKDTLISDINTWIIEYVFKLHPEMNSFDSFNIVLNSHMLEHALHNYEPVDTQDDRIDLATSHIHQYDAHRVMDKHVCETEFLPVDHYCLLAINSIMTNSISLTDTLTGVQSSILTDSMLVSLIVMAENAIINSPSNHQIKLILLKLYSFVGASKQCAEILLGLDIKHFQIDTLGHLLNPVLYNTGNYTLSRDSLDACLDFYAHGLRECFEGLTTSYRDGRFSKIEEISLVLRRLSDSLNASQCILLRGIVANLNAATLDELSQACQSFDQFGSLQRLFRHASCKDKLMDGRDFRVLKSLHFATNQLIQERQVQTFEDEQLWLRLRFFLLRSVYIQLDQFSAAKENSKKDGSQSSSALDEVQYGREEFEKLLPQLKERLEKSSADTRHSYLEPEASPFRWPHVKFDKLVELVRPLVFCTDPTTLTQKTCDDFMAALDDIVINLESQLIATNTLVSMKRTLMALTISVEFISLCCTSLVSLNQVNPVCSTAVTSNNSNTPNSKQSSQSTAATPQPTGQKNKSITNQLINKTEAQLTKLSNSIKSTDIKSLCIDKISHLQEGMSSLLGQKPTGETLRFRNLNPLIHEEQATPLMVRVKEKLLDSYTDSLKEIEGTCRRKIKLLRAKA